MRIRELEIGTANFANFANLGWSIAGELLESG